MKKFIVLLLVLAFMLPVFASGSNESSADAKAAAIAKADEGLDAETKAFLEGKDFSGQTLVVGVWGGDIETLLRENVIPPLEARGAKVELLLGGTSDRYAKIYMEKDNPTIDICYLNMYESASAVKDGIVEPVSDRIPAAKHMYDLATGAGYGCSLLGIGIAYNPNYFDKAPEWSDLWKPEYKGKIAFPGYPGSESEAFLVIAAMLNGGNEQNIDQGFEALAKLAPVPLVYNSLDELFLMMDKGDVVAAPCITGYAWSYVDKGMNVAVTLPSNPGSAKTMDVMNIVANNKHPELADAWAQLALSQKNQQAYADMIYFGPTNSQVVLTGQSAERAVYGDKVASLLTLDHDTIIANRAEWTKRWNKEIIENPGK